MSINERGAFFVHILTELVFLFTIYLIRYKSVNMNKYLILFFVVFCSLSPLFSCQVIYINGTSSVGKTTIIKALQDAMEEPFLRIGIDQVIDMMPEKVNNWKGGKSEFGFSWKQSFDAEGHSLQILEMGSFAKRIPGAMREIAATLVKNGFNLIIDDVATEENSASSWKAVLDGHDVIWVGLTAPIEVIEKREKERGDRLVGQARAAAQQVHKGFTYDLFIDTNSKTPTETALKIKEACRKKSHR